ncbi:MAG: hypothetical protein JKY34_07345 [Kordiimonadaceae bacterium]|nr:hypothetical protein [Kordiimonadaceae bacterium]
MTNYVVKRSHYNGRTTYKRGDPFPIEGGKLPEKPEMTKLLASGLIEAKSDKPAKKAATPKAPAKKKTEKKTGAKPAAGDETLAGAAKV